MNQELDLNAEEYKEIAINHIFSISFHGLCILMAFHHPPPAVLASLRYAQLILAGNF